MTLARARAEEIKMHLQDVQERFLILPLHLRKNVELGAGAVEMSWSGREHPVLESLLDLLLLFGLLDLGKAIEIGVAGELRRQRAIGAEKQNSKLLKTVPSARGHHARPPVDSGKILSGKGELLEI